MAKPSGWRLTTVDGTKKAINPQGEVVAYNQYLNAQAQMSGFKSHSHYRRWSREHLKEVKTEEKRSPKLKGKFGLGETTLLKYTEAFYDITTTGELVKIPKDQLDNSPRGRLHDWLVLKGVRRASDTHEVGETPD